MDTYTAPDGTTDDCIMSASGVEIQTKFIKGGSYGETFPHVKITSPCFTKSRLARNTFSFNFSNIMNNWVMWQYANLSIGKLLHRHIILKFKFRIFSVGLIIKFIKISTSSGT